MNIVIDMVALITYDVCRRKKKKIKFCKRNKILIDSISYVIVRVSGF